MAVAIRLMTAAGVDLVPSAAVVDFKYRASTASSLETDINGTPVMMSYESKASRNTGFDLDIGYVALDVVQDLIAAYQASDMLVLYDEVGVGSNVRISSYPTVERFKTVDGGATFIVRLALQDKSTNSSGAEVINQVGPTLFGR